MNGFTLTVMGPATGKGRPRFANGRTFTPKETVLAEQAVRCAWEDAGSPTLKDAPVKLKVLVVCRRPQGHYTTKGELSAQGKRNPLPHRRKPDGDNAIKMIMDSLNKRAWNDDVQVVDIAFTRVWGEQEFTWISAMPATEQTT